MKYPEIVSISKPESPTTDAYRILKSNIQTISKGKDVKIIMITSAGFKEGKTATASNLAVLMAQDEKKTILIDCHLRKPDVHKFFKLSNDIGLSNILTSNNKLKEAIQITSEKDLYVLTAGEIYPNPSKLIDSPSFNSFLIGLKEDFDCVILDAPPILMGVDAQILSKYVDGCIFVVATRNLDRQTVIEGEELLQKLNVNILGVVLNKADISTRESSKYYRKNKR